MSDTRDTMIREWGNETFFRCDCGCNVFHHPAERPDRYECNACGAWYHEADLTPSPFSERTSSDAET